MKVWYVIYYLLKPLYILYCFYLRAIFVVELLSDFKNILISEPDPG